MSRINSYNYMNVMLQSRGYSKEDAAKFIADAEADIYSKDNNGNLSDEDKQIMDDYKKSLREAEKTEAKINRGRDIYDNESYCKRENGKSKMDEDLDVSNKEKKQLKEQMDKILEESKKRAVDTKKIAQKIAKGKNATKKELEFIKENDPALYRKALAANQARKAKETRIMNIDDADELKRELMKSTSTISNEDDLTKLINDNTKELVKKKAKEKEKSEKRHDGFKAVI